MTDEDKQIEEKMKNPIYKWLYENNIDGIHSDRVVELRKLLIATIKPVILSEYISKAEVLEAFKLLDKGHGGGNFRRLIIQAKQRLGLDNE